MPASSGVPTGMPSNFNTTLKPFEDAGNEPLFDVQDQYKPLVATQNELVNGLKEPSREMTDLMAFENELLGMMFSCKDCGAGEHMTGLCKQREAVYNAQFTSSVDDVTNREQAARRKLSRGIPHDAPICPHHAEKAADDLKAAGMEHTKNFPVPGSTQGFLMTTALLPMCWRCFIRKTGRQVGTPVRRFDTCTCATGIIVSDCWVCAVLRIEGTKTLVLTGRMMAKTNGSTAIVCGCGEPDGSLPLVKQCAGCDGIVTLPTVNFLGGNLGFADAGAEGPTAIVPKQPISISRRPGTQPHRTLGPANYKPVSQMMKEQKHQQRHQVFSSAQMLTLRGYGLGIAAPITDSNSKVNNHPRLCLNALMESVSSPAPKLKMEVTNDILILCKFDIEQLTEISKTLTLLFDGEVTADNLGVLVSMALDTHSKPDADDVAWMDDFRVLPLDMVQDSKEKRVEREGNVDMANT